MGEEGRHTPLILKFFVHGLLFSVITVFMTILWAFVLVFLLVTGAVIGQVIGLIIGLIIGVIVLFFLYGGINTFLMEKVWGILTKEDWKSVLVHGFALFVILFVVSIPQIFVNALKLNLAAAIILFVFYCFVDGFVAKNIGDGWEEETPSTA